MKRLICGPGLGYVYPCYRQTGILYGPCNCVTSGDCTQLKFELLGTV